MGRVAGVVKSAAAEGEPAPEDDGSGLTITEEFAGALARLERGENLFLTGRAGTGKSTLIRRFLASTNRRVVVVAPTGIAALNVEGYTIHRLFSFGPRITVEQVRTGRYLPGRFMATLRTLDTLIIDEASMVRADLFDCLAVALQRFGPRPGTLFGGVQLVLVGDLFQLPPVVAESERDYFTTRYSSPYFFAADAYDPEHFPTVELTTVFRQIGDSRLVEILNAVRDGALLDAARAELNSRTDPDFRPPLDEFWLTLTTTNRIARVRNREMLAQIPGLETRHSARATGDLDGFDPPTDPELVYKVGAQIMLLTNHPDDRWVNGTIGRIADIRSERGEPIVVVEVSDGKVEVGLHTWEVTRPIFDGGALVHQVIGTYTQLPFRLAWAITIHKSQGQTLDRVVVDLSGGAFADGQLYVALSRCTTTSGLVLRRAVQPRDLKVDQRIRRFLRSSAAQQTRGNVYLGICTIGEEGRAWRPRPVEIAMVTDDGLELTTLVNPTRDMAHSRLIYGISAGDVQFAPLLDEAWAALAPHLAGRIPVGHEIDRQLGYVDHELKRNGRVIPMPVGIDLGEELSPEERRLLAAPQALIRARAARVIFRRMSAAAAEPFGPPGNETGYLLERGGLPECFAAGGEIPMISSPERVLAERLRVKVRETRLDDESMDLLRGLEERLGYAIIDPEAEIKRQNIYATLGAGARVCFSGSFLDDQGVERPREELEELARTKGLVPVETVTKSKCDALIVAEAGSQSGKARQAVKWEKPIFTAEQFLAWSDLF
ncbi:AAA family ATPase [Nocardia panacis]|uniref:AAA family ATPase n=2 Tax=Nocardia panacis TaxID=2340916 RepID=A0A3A4KKJ1_9NOCA|nr:AAA family ATPase [Nocardia panacis]